MEKIQDVLLFAPVSHVETVVPSWISGGGSVVDLHTRRAMKQLDAKVGEIESVLIEVILPVKHKVIVDMAKQFSWALNALRMRRGSTAGRGSDAVRGT